jgi:hypothetical protein
MPGAVTWSYQAVLGATTPVTVFSASRWEARPEVRVGTVALTRYWSSRSLTTHN